MAQVMKLLVVVSSFMFVNCAASLTEESDDLLPCTIAREMCHATVSKLNEEITFEVSCICKKSKDVSEALKHILPPLHCPYVPNQPEDKIVDKSILKLENCLVQEKEFPAALLKVLRRSKNLTIDIDAAQSLRLPTYFDPDQSEPVIVAKIRNSNVTGIGRGWFNNAKSLSLIIMNSSLGVLEAGVFSNYKERTVVDIQLENTNITVIKSRALSLPPDAQFTTLGGTIDQIEEYAIEGGNRVVLEGSRIANIGTKAFNLYGLHTFALKSCLIASVDRIALYQDVIGNRLKNAVKETEVNFVNITSNLFARLHGDAFAALCQEKRLKFKDNFIGLLTSPLKLQSDGCRNANLREWIHSVWNNGFRCDMELNTCDNFKDNTEMACVLRGTSWCRCNNHDDDKESSKESFDTIQVQRDNVTELRGHSTLLRNDDCIKTWTEHLKEKCDDIDEEVFSHCATIVHTKLVRDGRSMYIALSTAKVNIATETLKIMLIVYILRLFIIR